MIESHQHSFDLQVPVKHIDSGDFRDKRGKNLPKKNPTKEIKVETVIPDSGPVADEGFWERILSLFPH